ncbi:MAG: hypothetical protein ACRD0Y_08915 [Terriglobales bacterium]
MAEQEGFIERGLLAAAAVTAFTLVRVRGQRIECFALARALEQDSALGNLGTFGFGGLAAKALRARGFDFVAQTCGLQLATSDFGLACQIAQQRRMLTTRFGAVAFFGGSSRLAAGGEERQFHFFLAFEAAAQLQHTLQ